MHFSPAGTAPTGAEARPEWSVASDAEGGMRRAVRAVRTPSDRGVPAYPE
ncbi:hypothetical protein [Haladaptatus sp. DYF46]|nr:hypothetical protein [Haladaptatus sp. DYF46]